MATMDTKGAAMLRTNRLIIRPVELSDAPAFFAFKSDPSVTSLYGQEPHRDIEETRRWIQRNLPDREGNSDILWSIQLKDEVKAIGSCCLWNFDVGRHCAEIGYELHPSYWHKGIMSEAASAMVTFGFTQLHLHRIEADPLCTNEHSIQLLRKLGFRQEGTLRQRHFFGGQYVDQLIFGLLENEWSVK
jgi:[ribosomal protein S5]-alanine N-acetyltransferase